MNDNEMLRKNGQHTNRKKEGWKAQTYMDEWRVVGYQKTENCQLMDGS
jgi:hypothetical protein